MRAAVRTPWLDAHVDCAPGTVTAVTGPNGAGKSSLLRALAGLGPGSVEADDDHWGSLPAYRRDVGWVPQTPSLLPRRTARDDVAYPLRARGVRRHEARDRAEEWLTRMGVGELALVRGERLSGGQAARVMLARALVHEPSLLLLDEPLAAVDADARPGVRRVLRTAVEVTGAACLLVTHDPEDVAALADRVLRLRDGRVVTVPS